MFVIHNMLLFVVEIEGLKKSSADIDRSDLFFCQWTLIIMDSYSMYSLKACLNTVHCVQRINEWLDMEGRIEMGAGGGNVINGGGNGSVCVGSIRALMGGASCTQSSHSAFLPKSYYKST